MNLKTLIEHPEQMNKETLYELRELTARYPYYQTARLLMLQNLYLLHESSFDDELRRAAIYLTDRTRLFDLVEARHYQLRDNQPAPSPANTDRTTSLIDEFLDNLPTDETPSSQHISAGGKSSNQRRKPTVTDATVDYVAYLLESDDNETDKTTQMRGQELIDKFINDDGGKIQLQENPEYTPQIGDDSTKLSEEGYFTATLARIYVKQGRYSKALEIIKRLNLNYPKKSAYFADQIRFLEKLVANSTPQDDKK